MKNMHDFHKRLSSAEEKPTSHWRRLRALTCLSRTRLMRVTSAGTWFIWEAEQSPARS